ELDRGRRRLARALEELRVGKLSGAVGTYAATDPELERLACERLGLEPAPTSTQILQRDRHAELLCALAVLASSLETFATEIRHLARTVRLPGRGPRRPYRADAAQPRREPPPVLQPARAARARRVRARARRCVPPRAARRDARERRGGRLPRARPSRSRDRESNRPR